MYRIDKLKEESLAYYNQAIYIWTHLVEDKGIDEHTVNLAKVMSNKAAILMYEEEYAEGLETYDKSLAIWNRLIQSGRTELKCDRACIELEKAAFQMLNNPGNRLHKDKVRQAIAMLQAEIRKSGREDLYRKIDEVEKAIQACQSR